MKKVMLSVAAALAVSTAAPAFAADMPVKAKVVAPAPAPSPFDIAFGTAFTTNYVLRGISQSNNKPAVQGYFELQYKPTDWVTLYAGIWGSSLYTGFANAEFDISGGARFAWGNFGLDLGYVYYAYPGPAGTNLAGGSSLDYGEVYAKPSYKFTDWLTVGGVIIGGGDIGNTSQSGWYYAGNVAVVLPPMVAGITTTISGEVGRQTYASGYKVLGTNIEDYTTWNVGVAFNWKAITLDLRYFDTDIDSTTNPTQCATTTASDACKQAFVATLKFDTTISALK